MREIESGDCSPYQNLVEESQRAFKFELLVKVRGIRYATCTLTNYETDGDKDKAAMVERMRVFCEEMPDRIRGGGGLVLLGPPGTGKDHVMMAAMRAAILHHGLQPLWYDGLRLYQSIKAAIANNDTESLLSDCVSPHILAISDPVPERGELSPYETSILRDIVERRYSSCRTTWVTTNVQTSQDAQRLFGSAVLDRLLHNAHQEFFGWKSKRTSG